MNESFDRQLPLTTIDEDKNVPEELETQSEKREKLRTAKIVVAGPPHSGKSVFLGALSNNLPREDYYLFRACPDGEGSWLGRNYDDPEVVKLRRKGKFSEENVDWYCTTLSQNNMKPIVLVDIGGIPSAENARILREGDVHYGVVLSGTPEAIPEWEAFLRQNGVEILASLHSDYQGIEDSVTNHEGKIVGTVHHLERGEEGMSERPAVHALAERILMLKDSLAQQAEQEVSLESLPKESLDARFVHMATEGMFIVEGLADILGKEKRTRTLPNGRVIEQIIWEGPDLTILSELFTKHEAIVNQVICIDGAAPAWLIAGISSIVAPRPVIINSPDGFVFTGIQEPSAKGTGAEWHTEQIGTTEKMGIEGPNLVIVQSTFALNPSVPLEPKQLAVFSPPMAPSDAVVVISGRGPNWLVSSIADAYRDKVAAVACFQPGTGATVIWSRENSVPRGSIIPVKI